ncbi:PWI domain [Rhizoctonia solani]|uniref:PWI domain n=1 Tax=Rhizoctonia solani TaxID=456999 RepID=A0A8H7INU0_9AGAM|nr:PWI domain [Rhizoctonia solani]
MADAGFFKGTSAEQDRRFADKEHRLLKSIKFPPEFDRKVDMRKVELSVMRPWITKKVVELVGFEDEVVVEYVMGLLEDRSKPPDPKVMQINLTGFLESKTPAFMSSLWALLLEAQDSPAGVPASFVQEKKEELRQKHETDERALAEARRRGEHDLRLDEIRQRERGERRGRGGGRGGGDSFRGRGRDSGWGNRGGGGGGGGRGDVRHVAAPYLEVEAGPRLHGGGTGALLPPDLHPQTLSLTPWCQAFTFPERKQALHNPSSSWRRKETFSLSSPLAIKDSIREIEERISTPKAKGFAHDSRKRGDSPPPPPSRRRDSPRRTTSRSPSPNARKRQRSEPGVDVEPLSIKGAASGKKSRWDEGQDEKDDVS